MTYQMNDDEWLMQQLALESDNDCVLGGNLVRISSENSDVTDTAW